MRRLFVALWPAEASAKAGGPDTHLFATAGLTDAPILVALARESARQVGQFSSQELHHPRPESLVRVGVDKGIFLGGKRKP